MDYHTLGPTPAEEDCAQMGKDDYQLLARKEGKAYINQLRRLFPHLLGTIDFRMKFFPHDFGSYGEVCVIFDNDNEAAVAAMIEVDNNIPSEWDAEARVEMGIACTLADITPGKFFKTDGHEIPLVATTLVSDDGQRIVCVEFKTGVASWMPLTLPVTRFKHRAEEAHVAG